MKNYILHGTITNVEQDTFLEQRIDETILFYIGVVEISQNSLKTTLHTSSSPSDDKCNTPANLITSKFWEDTVQT